MPNCFTLTRKSDLESGPVAFAKIDDEMCGAFGITPDPKKYYCQWYDIVGFGLAVGKSFSDLREIWHDQPKYLQIVDWLDENFTSDAWCERY